MNVLVACEYSGTVRDAFRERGHEAWSCDLLPSEGIYTDYHYQGSALDILDGGWDLLIAHPPCTYLSYAATRCWNRPGRDQLREEGMEFFLRFYNANIPHICVENPVGLPNTILRKPDQIIHPYYFGDPHLKRTCLWLSNLPCLHPTNQLPKPAPLGYYTKGPKKGKAYYFTDAMPPSPERVHLRSKTFQGIANAMADQWGNL